MRPRPRSAWPAFWARTPWACPLPQKLTEQEVLDAAEAAKEKFSGLLLACLAHLDEA